METSANLAGTGNVTELRRREDRFTESEDEYRKIVQSVNSIIIKRDLQGRITFANRYALHFFGYDEIEILGRHVVGSIVPEIESTGRNLEVMIEEISRHPDRFVSNINENVKRSGERVWIAWTNGGLFDDSETMTGILSVGNDLTAKKRMEEEILKMNKLESIGILAGGIAHDFNNLLAVILLNLGFARMQCGLDEKVAALLGNAEEATNRAKEITQRFITFSRGGRPIKKRTAAADLIRKAANIALRDSSIRCLFQVEDPLPLVDIDKDQIGQAIHNIVLNAREAMRLGGTIRISAVPVSLDECSNLPLPQGTYVRISIEDEGPGIPAADVHKVFDPYFTTKGMGPGNGVGLGLTVCFSIMRQHQGWITAESSPGKGTTFHMYLPAAGK